MKHDTKEKNFGFLSFTNLSQKEFYKNKWIVLFLFVAFFIFTLSLRFLSDPDLGFHLNTGKWIIENLSFPDKDTFTFSASENDYIDLHWMFQILIFFLYKIIGYEGLSVFVACLSMIILFFLLRRNYFFEIPLYLSCVLFILGFLIIEPRITLRPEMFTFIFITLVLLILDNYYYRKTHRLFLLPILMIFWCNMHGLFILGFVLIGAYFVSICFRDKKIDKYFLFWMIISFVVCLINPYFLKGFVFPLELFTRFDSNNIYNQHIKEFTSFFQIDTFTVKDVLFVLFFIVTFLSTLITLKKRKLHELTLLIIFSYLALISIRNIPLFVIVAIPITGISIKELIDTYKRNSIITKIIRFKTFIFCVLFLIPVFLLFRLFTNSYYYSNNSYYKTGIGLDTYQQPDVASTFILENNVKGKILNSIGYGGWLGWRTHQPVFIDGRLEVMKENLYNRIVKSWDNGLSELIHLYKPDLIVYNYQKYYTWTDQIAKLPEWKLIYLDGVTVIFAHKDSVDIPEIDLSLLPEKYNLSKALGNKKILEILNSHPPSSFKIWIEGFYKKTDFSSTGLLNIASFCFQFKQYEIAEKFFIEVLKNTQGNESSVYYALAEIYRISGDLEKENICLQKISALGSENKLAVPSLSQSQNTLDSNLSTNVADDNNNEAITFFNSGNEKYKNGDADGALNDYNKAIEMNPNYYKAYNNRAIIKTTEYKKDAEALKDFNKAIEINPEYADAYLGRGTLQYNLKNTEEACKDWEKALSLGNTQASLQIEKYCK
jgi:tetratricopeptide (TPR) repeat protein